MSYQQNLTTMEKNTILFLIPNRNGIAFKWDFYFKNKNKISEMFVNRIPYIILYKVLNNPGVDSWVDYSRASNNGYIIHNADNSITIINQELLKVTNIVIPQTKYIDSEGYEYSIGINDGYNSLTDPKNGKYVLLNKFTIEGSKLNEDKTAYRDYIEGETIPDISIQQGSYINKNLTFANRHLMDDVKLIFNKSLPKNCIITLNSQLRPFTVESWDPKTLWIKEGLRSSMYISNDFITNNKTYGVQKPIIIQNEIHYFPNKIGTETLTNYDYVNTDGNLALNMLEPQTSFKFFFSNSKEILYAFKLTSNNSTGDTNKGDLYKSYNITTNEWVKCAKPILNTSSTGLDIGYDKLVYIPYKDSSKNTDILFAFDIGLLKTDGSKRYYAYSSDYGSTWTTVEYNHRIYPIFLPDTDGICFISDMDSYKVIHKFNGTTNIIEFNPTYISGIPENEDLRNFFYAGMIGRELSLYNIDDPETFLGWNSEIQSSLSRFEDYIYNTYYAGDFETYLDKNLFTFTNSIYLKYGTKWISLNTPVRQLCQLNGNTNDNINVYVQNFDVRFIEIGSDPSLPQKYCDIQVITQSYSDNDANVTLNYSKMVIKKFRRRYLINDDLTTSKYYNIDPQMETITINNTMMNIPYNNYPRLNAGSYYYINKEYLGIPNLSYNNKYNRVIKTDSEEYTIQNSRLLSSLEIYNSKIVLNNISTGDLHSKYVHVKNATSSPSFDSYGLFFHQVLYDGNGNVLFIGDEKENYNDQFSKPFIYIYNLRSNLSSLYEMRVKAYQWNGVKCTQQIIAKYIKDPNDEIKVSSCVNTPTIIGFPIDINPNAFLLLYNGIPILDGSAYVNPKNNKEIICENISRYRVIQNYINPVQYYINTRNYIHNDFTAISFSSEDTNKDVYIYIDKAHVVDNSNTYDAEFHSEIKGDLVLFNGIDHEFLIDKSQMNRIKYIVSRYGLNESPRLGSIYSSIGSYNYAKDATKLIARIQFYLRDK